MIEKMARFDCMQHGTGLDLVAYMSPNPDGTYVRYSSARVRENALLEAAQASLAMTDCEGECEGRGNGNGCAHHRLLGIIRQIESTR